MRNRILPFLILSSNLCVAQLGLANSISETQEEPAKSEEQDSDKKELEDFFSTLPPDMIRQILLFNPNLTDISKVDSSLHSRIANDEQFWLARFVRDFGTVKKSNDLTWKAYYKQVQGEIDTIYKKRHWTNHQSVLVYAIRNKFFKLFLSKTDEKLLQGYLEIHALELSAKVGNIEVMEYLIKRGSEINRYGDYSETPLFEACKGNQIEAVKLLLKHNADVNLKYGHVEDGGAPLHMAAKNGNVEIMKLLIAKGAEIDSEAYSKVTPLHYALKGGHFEAAALLIEHGADPLKERDWDSINTVYYASEGGSVEAMKLLLSKGASLNMKTQRGVTPIIAAADKGHTAMVEFLISQGVDVNDFDEYNTTALYMAADRGHEDMVRILLAAGAKSFKLFKYYSPSFIAAQNGHTEILKLTLDSLPEDLKDIDFLGDSRTALCMASQNGRTESVKVLLQYGASVHVKCGGAAPIWHAIREQRVEIVKILLNAGGAKELTNKEKEIYFERAKEKGNADIIKFLEDAGFAAQKP